MCASITEKLIRRVPNVARFLLDRYDAKLSRSEREFLELHIGRSDWIEKDIEDVRRMLPLHLRCWLP